MCMFTQSTPTHKISHLHNFLLFFKCLMSAFSRQPFNNYNNNSFLAPHTLSFPSSRSLLHSQRIFFFLFDLLSLAQLYFHFYFRLEYQFKLVVFTKYLLYSWHFWSFYYLFVIENVFSSYVDFSPSVDSSWRFANIDVIPAIGLMAFGKYSTVK